MYSIDAYAQMLLDDRRMRAYFDAVRRAIQPGSTVLDLGAGPGVLSVLACKLGARKVFAVDRSETVHIGKEIAAANGCADAIEFIRSNSLQIQLPEKVDLIVSDLRGALPLFGRHIPTIIDARTRFLAPDGQLIPRRDKLWAALVNLPGWYSKHIAGLGELPLHLDMDALRHKLVNSLHRSRITPENMLTEAACWGELDYARIDNPNLEAELNWRLTAEGTAHGIGLWFETELDEQAGFSNGPESDPLIYGQLVLPLEKPVHLRPGDTICIVLQARLVGDDYVWNWTTNLENRARHRPLLHLQQSTFYSSAFSADQFKTSGDDYRPSLDEEGGHASFVLSLMAPGRYSMREIAKQLAEKFPSRFPSGDEALAAVKTLARQFGR